MMKFTCSCLLYQGLTKLDMTTSRQFAKLLLRRELRLLRVFQEDPNVLLR